VRVAGTYAIPQMDSVIYGQPCADAVAAEARRLSANRVFLVASGTLSSHTDEIARVRTALGARFAGVYDRMGQHTSRMEAAAATAVALEAKADLLVGIGGGSVIDGAKIMVAMLEHNMVQPDDLDGFEVTIGPDGRPQPSRFRPPRVRMIAVPTTLSGGEYNAGALVTDPRRKLKQAFFHPLMMPRSVILDPALALHTPLQLWLGSGTRAMDHGIEALLSPAGNPLVDAVVSQGLRLLTNGLTRSKAIPDGLEARRQCQFGAWLSSFGWQARVPMGASHAIGHVLGGTCDVPHYLCTAVMMPSVLRYNEPVTQEAQRVLAEALGHPNLDAATAFAELIAELGLPRKLSEVGITSKQFPLIGETVVTNIFARTNPRPLRAPADVIEILKLAA
jgi:maleylacetate reductase